MRGTGHSGGKVVVHDFNTVDLESNRLPKSVTFHYRFIYAVKLHRHR